jgi:hypothetical protein
LSKAVFTAFIGDAAVMDYLYYNDASGSANAKAAVEITVAGAILILLR